MNLDDDVQAELARLKAENERLKREFGGCLRRWLLVV